MKLYVLVMMFWLDGKWVEFQLPPITKEQCHAVLRARLTTKAHEHKDSLMYCTPEWTLRKGKA